MGVTYRPGYFCDVAVWIDGRLIQVTSDGPLVRCYLENDLVWQQTASEPLMFCRAAVHQGLVLSIHQGHDSGRGWLVGQGIVRDLGLTFGVQPVAIDARYAYVVRSGYTYDQIDLQSGEVLSLPSPVPGSSQGISDINPVDGLWWADLHRSTVISGETFTYPNVRGPVTVGQTDPPSISAAVNGAVSAVVLGDGYEPHVAVSGSRAAVCARTPQGAAYAVLVASTAPPPVEKVPGPIYQEVSVSVPNQLSTVQSIRAKYPTPLGAQHGAFLVEVGAATGGALLRKDAGTNVLLPPPYSVLVSQDILGFGNGAECYDILQDGEGAAIPTWSEKGPIPGVYVTVSGAVTPPTQPPTQPPASGLSEADVQRMIDAAFALPRKVALKSSRGRYGRDDWEKDEFKFDSTVVNEGEVFTIEPQG